MKKNIFIAAILVLLSACSHKVEQPNITVENNVTFEQRGKSDYISFAFVVSNLGEEPVPELSYPNLRKFAKFLVNGEETRPPSGFSGYDTRHGSLSLSLNRCDQHSEETLVEDARKLYGNTFTVQWEYMGILSRLLEVDMDEKSVKQVEKDK